MAIRLNILGPPEVHNHDGSPVSLSLGKPLALLVYVACHPEGILRDDLASLLWPDAPREKGRHSVRQAIWVLKNACGEDLFEGDDPLGLRNGILESDIEEFKEALADRDLPRARGLWKGPVLDNFYLAGSRQWDRWMEDLRADLERRFQQTLLLSARDLREEGRLQECLAELEFILEVNPQVEEAHTSRIQALLELLRLDEAREALADAFGTVGDRPESRETLQGLEERIDEAAREQRARVREAEGFTLEFVGRSRELGKLRNLWKDAEVGRTRACVITGPSGIGKTRLGREFRASLKGREMAAVEVRGSRSEMKLRWGSAADLIRQLLLLPGSAGVSPASDGLLRAMIPSLGRGDVSLQTVNGVSAAALLDALADLLEAVAFEAPLLVALDDFQWYDGESRTLLLGAMRRVREDRIFFLVQGRSDLSSRSWDEQERSLVEEAGAYRILLEALAVEELQELLGLVARFSDPEELNRVARQIHGATGGNPLFIRAILQELADEGVLARRDGEWIFHSEDLPLRVDYPDSVMTLLGERLDRLSEEAGSLAGALAGAGRGCSFGEIRKATGMEDATISGALTELLEHDIVAWSNDAALDFSHDLMRQAAADFFPADPARARSGRPWPLRHRGVAAVITLIGISLLAGALWAAKVGSGPPTPAPYGGGALMLELKDGRVFLQPTPGDPVTWEVLQGPPPPDSGLGRPFLGPGGQPIWLGVENRPDGPDLVQFLPGGVKKVLLSAPGDQTAGDVSPDGKHLLFVSENVGREKFSRSLWLLPLLGGPARLLYDSDIPLENSFWSWHTDLIAVTLPSDADTVVFLSLAGQRVGSLVFPKIERTEWCGGFLLATVEGEAGSHLVRIRPPGSAVDTLAHLDLGRVLTCSPDGSGLVHLGVVDRKVQALLRDLETGTVQPIPTGGEIVFDAVWVPDGLTAVPRALRVASDTLRLRWGERTTIPAFVQLSDGSTTRDGVRWESMDPSVATVNRELELVGNGVGRTRLVARWGYSFADTVLVEVMEQGSAGAFLREDFARIDTTVWLPIGNPQPAVIEFEGDSVLLLRGDDKYADGLISLDPIPLDQGVTVELEFRLHLTRTVHQSVYLCLKDIDPDLYRVEEHAGSLSREDVCFRYPRDEFQKLDPREGSFLIRSGLERPVRVPDVFPPEEWTHVAIQVRADGEVSLVVDREVVARSAVRIDTDPDNQWALMITGNAVEARPMIRNLTIWRELRSAAPPPASPGR